jgi:CSLREA domain-containing protein
MGLALGNATDNIILLNGSQGVSISSVISGANKKLTLSGAGTGTLTLGGFNTYSGDTTINTNKLALIGAVSIDNTPNIVISGNGTFDVSGLTAATFNLTSGQGLKATGTTSNGVLAMGTKNIVMASNSPLQFTAYNGTNNPLSTSGTTGTLNLVATNPVTVTTTTQLGVGTYTLISKSTGGGVAGTAPTSVTVNGSGLASGTTASLAISSGNLVLNVVNAPLSGTYTVGAGGNFTTLTAAVAAYVSRGVSAPVTFSLTDATYASETYPITIGAATGSSATNTLTIKPTTGISPTFSSSTATVSMITFNGGSNVIIDGSNASGGTSRDLTFSNTNTTGNAIRLDTNAASIIVKNCTLKGTGTSGVVWFLAAGSGNITGTNIQNNAITASVPASPPALGLYMAGTSTNLNNNNKITGNSISDFYWIGLDRGGKFTDTVFADNLIFESAPVNASNSTLYALIAETSGGGTITMSGNKVFDLKTTSATTVYGLANLSGSDLLTAKNNFIFLETSSTSPTSVIYGAYNSGANINLYYNSIYVGGSGVTSGGSYAFDNAWTNATLNLKNNIFFNARSNASGSAKHYGIGTVTPLTNLTSDYNDILVTGTGGVFGYDGTADRATLLAWQTATLKDLNSKSADPLFTSATDLHITSGSSPASNAGTPIAGITTDIDGETRSALTPDIGADEFTPANLVQFRSKQSGNWNATATWETSTDGTNWIPALTTPTSANGAITVRNTHQVHVTASVNADELTVNTGGLLLVNNGVTFTIDDGTGTDLTIDAPAGLVGTAGNVTNNGQAQVNGVLRIDDGGFPGGGTGTYAYDQTTGTLAFNNSTGPYGINNFNFWPASNGPQNVSVGSGGIQMNVARTVGLTFVTSGGVFGAGNLTFNGLFNIFNGGFVSGSPTYGSASTLQYSTGGTYGRNGEWLAVTSGAGYPANVQLSNNTTLDMSNGGIFNNAPSQMSGTLTIDSGSKMQLAGSTPLTQPLNVLGNVNNSGNLTLSTSVGGDINVGGNWMRAAAGTFTPNGRTVTFNGSVNQTVSVTGGGTEIFNYLVVNKSGGSLLADISPNATGMTVNATTGDVLKLLSGGINLQSNQTSLTLSGNGGNVLVSGGARSINGSGSVSFTGSKTVTSASGGTLSFGSAVTVSLSASVDFGVNLSTINGTLQIGAGGSVNTNPPTYASGSTLNYSTHTTYGRGAEWSATSGAGYPSNVIINNTTVLDMGANGGTSTARQMAGNLQVQPGSTLQMAGTNAMTAPLAVTGSIANGGTINFSTAAGGDIKVGDYFDNGAFGTPGVINGNGRRLHFIGNGSTQGIFNGSATSLTLPSLVINKPAGSVQLNVNLIVNPSADGEGISFKTAQSKLDLNGKTLTLSDGTFDSVAGSGLTGGGTLILNGSGDAGTLPFGIGNPSLNGLTVNRTGAGGNVALGSSLTVFNTLTLTAGIVNTGANTLTLHNSGTVARTNGYVIGTLQKLFNAPASFTFDIGTSNGYSPVEANSTTGTGSLSVKPTETKQPNIAGANALARYWTLNGSGITTNLTFHYLATDVVGTESNYQVVKYNGSFSVPPNQSVNAGAHTATVTGVNSFSDWTLAEASSVFSQLQFSAANYNDSETNATHNATITVQRTGSTSGAVSVHYATSDGTATGGNDYTAASGDLNWTDGDGADKTFSISVNGDTTYEADETVTLTLSNPTGGATISGTNPATLTITNDDAPPATLVVNTTADTNDGFCSTDAGGCTLREAIGAANSNSDASTITFNIPNGDAGCTGGVCTVTMASVLPEINANLTINGTGANALTVRRSSTASTNFRIFKINSGVTATISGMTITGGFYPASDNGNGAGILNNGTLNLESVAVSGNGTFGSGGGILNDGTLNLSNSTVSGNNVGTLGGGIASGILSNSSVLNVTNSTVSGNTANTGGGISIGIGTGITNATATISNSTVNSNDATCAGGGLSSGVGNISLTNVTVSGNSGGSNCAGGGGGISNNATLKLTNVTISNNDGRGNGGGINNGGTASLANTIVANNTVTLSSDPDLSGSFSSLGFNLIQTPGSATINETQNAGTNITGVDPLLGSLQDNGGPTFTRALLAGSPAIDKGKNFATDASNDPILTDQRGLTRPVDLDDATYPNAASGDASDIGAFEAQTLPPSLSINDVTMNEGDSSTTSFVFTVTKTGTGTASVSYATADGTATTADSDYQSNSDTLTFAANETTKQITVLVNGDTKFETNEAFTVHLSNASGATIVRADGTGTITNDDAAPAFSINDVTLNEGNTGTTNFVFQVTKSGATSQSASVAFATADGTATTSDSDYDSNSDTLTFAANETDKTITVAVHGDTTYEANETFFVNLSTPTNASITDSQGVGTITNDDAPPTNLVVNTTDDNDDGLCDASHCSLREAINAANFASDANTISFAIPNSDAGYNATAGVWTIKPTSPLPGITKPLTINGYTQTGASANTLTDGDDAALKIELDGESAGANTNGLSVAADSTVIRGLVINRFAGAGVRVTANSCTVAGNFIGTDATGTLAFDTVAGKSYGNGTGVLINFTVAVSSGIGNNVGGTNKADRNLVSASAGDGIRLDGVGTAANNVLGNFIGTDKTGTKIKDANDKSFGNLGSGVALYDSRNNQIGAPGSFGQIGGNVIGASGEHGVEIASGASFGPNGNVIIGNFIGTDPGATLNLGNSGDGVRLGKDASENSIGNAQNGGNVIAYNGGNGITLAADAKQQNPIRNNSIHDNTGLGIDLGADGVTANDNGDPSHSIAPDADTGPNNLQNFPVITSATATGSERDITGTLKSTPNQSFFITLFVNPSCDASGNGEGQTLLAGLAPITTDANGDATFNYHVSSGALSPAVGDFVTATATDFSNNTSEFSPCKQVVDGNAGAIRFTASSYTVNESDGTASISVERVGGSEGDISADFTTTDGTAHAPDDYTDGSTTVQFNDGVTGTKTINVSINDDSLYEGDETVSLSLSTTTVTRAGVRSKPLIQPSAGTSATLTITDNETPPSFSVNDVIVSEPQSGTSNATFTVTLSGASQAPVSVNYSTADGTASAPTDYLAASGTLNFASGETSKPVSVTINADALIEGNETFTLNLSSPTSPLTISDDTGQGTIVDPTLDGQVIISEFRLRGAQGAQDEFVELYNNTSRDITVGTDDGSDGWALAAIMPDGTSVDLLTTIPAGTVIPAHAHFLLADAPSARGAQGYSLGVTPDLTYDCDIDDGAGVALFRTGDTASFSTGTRLDAAGFSNLTGALADLFREGAGLTSPGANDGEYSFVRNLTTGFPLDTNDNAHDFFFVSTDGGNYGDVPSTLGAPGPENLASPVQHNNLIKASPIDPGCTGTSVTPGDACARYRDTTPDPDASHNSALGTLSIRRKFTNTTNQPVTQLRFRVVDVTTRAGGASPPAGTADVRVRSSQNFTATTSGGGNVFIKGLTLEEPPTQSAGGGLNSTLAAGTITLQTPLAANGAINLDFLLGVQQSGRFRIFVNVEPIFDSPPTSSAQKRAAPKAAAPVKMK